LLRGISLLLALGCGCLALAWGLFYLHDIFVEERDDALAAIAARRLALEQYAQKELEQRLRSRLDGATRTIDAAEEDPLIPADELWLVDRGTQVLPRTARPRPGTETPATDLYRELRGPRSGWIAEQAQGLDPESPWAARLSQFEQLKAALVADDREGIENAVRTLLALRASYVISAKRDIPLTLATLSELSDRATPHRSLMAGLLRDGLQGSGSRIEGLQRKILLNRARFTAGDMQFFKARIVELARPAGVLHADFAGQVDAPPGKQLELPADLDGPTLSHGGEWYVVPGRNDRVRGLAVNLSALLSEITATMRERTLLGDEDVVEGDVGSEPVAVPKVALTIDSPTWEPATTDVAERYRLKAFLEVLIAALVFGVMGLGAWVYWRRRRFVELKSDFVSAVSHELRTPLASIRLMAETLERRTKDVPRVRDYPSRIVRDIDGLSFLVENILSFNRLSRGRWTPQLGSMRLAEVVAKLDRERDSWARRPAELTSSGLDEVELTADADLLQLLFTNLVRNACQYNKREPATIDIRAERSNGWLVHVADNGIGIPKSERDRVFDDFYRAGSGKSSGERGSGLGLAICRKIMEAHGGTIRVAATGPEGTTFELRFKVATAK